MLPSSIDGVVERVSGSYQFLLLLLLLINLVHVSIHSSITEHHLTTPEHHCKLPEGWEERKWLPTVAVSASKQITENRDNRNKEKRFAIESPRNAKQTNASDTISFVNDERYKSEEILERNSSFTRNRFGSRRASRAIEWNDAQESQRRNGFDAFPFQFVWIPRVKIATSKSEWKCRSSISKSQKSLLQYRNFCKIPTRILSSMNILVLCFNRPGQYIVKFIPLSIEDVRKEMPMKLKIWPDARKYVIPGKIETEGKIFRFPEERKFTGGRKLLHITDDKFIENDRRLTLWKCFNREHNVFPRISLKSWQTSNIKQSELQRQFFTKIKFSDRKEASDEMNDRNILSLSAMITFSEGKKYSTKRDAEKKRRKRWAKLVVDESPFVLPKENIIDDILPITETEPKLSSSHEEGKLNRNRLLHGAYSFEIIPEEILPEEINTFRNFSRIHRIDVHETDMFPPKSQENSRKTSFRSDLSTTENKSRSTTSESFIKSETFDFRNLNESNGPPVMEAEIDQPNVWSTTPIRSSTSYAKGFVTYSPCEMYVDSFDREKGTKPCVYGYIFQLQDSEWSITAEWGLVCDRAWLRPWLSTITHCGGAIGALCGGLLADKLGRRRVLVGAVWGAGVLGVSIYLVRRLVLFVALRGIQELCLQAMWVVSWVLVSETLPHNARLAGLLSSSAAGAVGAAAATAAAHFLQTWRSVQLAVSLPLITSVIYVWVIPEPIRWLLASGESGRALEESHRTARYNRRKLPPSTEAHVGNLATAAARKSRSKPGFLALLLAGARLRKSVVILLWSWFFASLTSSMTYHSIMISASHDDASQFWLKPLSWAAQPGNKFQELLQRMHSRVWIVRLSAISAVRLAAVLTFSVLLSLIRRKFLLMTSHLLTTFLTVALVAVRLFWTGSEALSSLLLSVILTLEVLVCHGAFCTLTVVSLDILPTVARASGLGVLAAAAAIGQLVLPLFLLVGSLTYPFVPWVILSSGTFISSLLTLLLPDTTSTTLPDFAEDSEMLGRKLTLFRSVLGREPRHTRYAIENSHYRGHKRINYEFRRSLPPRQLTGGPRSFSIRPLRFASLSAHRSLIEWNSTCSRCSIMSVIDVSQNNGNTSDSTECKSFRRYPLEKIRKSIRRRSSSATRSSVRTDFPKENRSLKLVKQNNASESSEEIGPSMRRGVGRIDVLSRSNESKAVQTNFRWETSSNKNTRDDYSHTPLCSIEMKDMKPSKSSTNSKRNSIQSSVLCDACKESTSLNYNKKNNHQSELSTPKNLNKWKSQTQNDLSKISGPPSAGRTIGENHGFSPKAGRKCTKTPELRPMTSGTGHVIEKTSMARKNNAILDAKPVTLKADPIPALKPKPRVSKDIFMRLQELKKAAKITGECELFSEIHSRSSDCTASSSKVSEGRSIEDQCQV